MLPQLAIFAAEPETAQPPPPQVLQEAIVYDNSRLIIMQRLDRAPAPSVAPVPQQVVAVEDASQFEDEAALKPHHLLFLSCTVYDHQVSLVRWSVEGRPYQAYVNADFNDVAGGIGSFEDAEGCCSLFMAVGNETAESLSLHNADLQAAGYPLIELPAPASFPAGYSSYMLSGSADPAHVEADCKGLEALLAHFDANKAALQQARQQRETERLQREQYLRDHPPQPQNTVIQFWPVKSQRYPVAQEVQP